MTSSTAWRRTPRRWTPPLQMTTTGSWSKCGRRRSGSGQKPLPQRRRAPSGPASWVRYSGVENPLPHRHRHRHLRQLPLGLLRPRRHPCPPAASAATATQMKATLTKRRRVLCEYHLHLAAAAAVAAVAVATATTRWHHHRQRACRRRHPYHRPATPRYLLPRSRHRGRGCLAAAAPRRAPRHLARQRQRLRRRLRPHQHPRRGQHPLQASLSAAAAIRTTTATAAAQWRPAAAVPCTACWQCRHVGRRPRPAGAPLEIATTTTTAARAAAVRGRRVWAQRGGRASRGSGRRLGEPARFLLSICGC